MFSQAYSNVHRAFLQSCVLHSMLTPDRAIKILTHLYAQYEPNKSAPTEDRLQTVIAEINDRIGRYEQRLVWFEYDPTQTSYLIAANLSDTPLDRVQGTYTAGELDFFRTILHGLAKEETHRMGQIECLNLTAQMETTTGKHLTKSRAEELLVEWQTMGYLALENDEFGFGPRMMVEFDRYLANYFPDEMQHCRLCKEILFYGTRCEKCSEVLHKGCIKKYLQRMKKCPACKNPWTG